MRQSDFAVLAGAVAAWPIKVREEPDPVPPGVPNERSGHKDGWR